MRKPENFAVYSVVGIVLLFTILLPPGFSALADQRLIGRVITQPLPELSAEAAPVSLIDKLNLIAAYNGQDTESVVMASQKQRPEEAGYQREPFVYALEELQKLQDLGVLPELELAAGYQRREYSLNTYMDMTKPAAGVQVWELPLYTGEFNAYIWLDAETHQIYQFYFGAGSADWNLDREKVLQGMGDYLGLPLGEIRTLDESSLRGIYQAKEREAAYLFSFGAHSLEVNLTAAR